MNATTKSRNGRSATPAGAPAAAPRGEPASQRPSVGRTVVNLLLFVHLFSLGLLMAFGGSSIVPDGEPPKMLQPKLRRVPGYYLQLLAMEVDFDSGQRFPDSSWVKFHADEAALHLKQAEDAPTPAARKQFLAAAKGHLDLLDPIRAGDPRRTHRGLYHLTYGDALDVGHLIEFRFDEDGREQVIRLPAADMGGQQRIRYQALAREAARLTRADAEGGEVRDVLPTAVVEHLMAQTGVTAGEVRILRRGTQLQQHVTQSEIALQEEAWRKNPWDDNWLATVFERKAQRSASGKILFINLAQDKLSAPAPEEEK
jgi:hypothetical protein